MAKVTGKYETLFIVNPTLGEEDAAAVADKFKALVEATPLRKASRTPRRKSCRG